MLRIILFIGTFFYVGVVFAQLDDPTINIDNKINYDTSRIENYSDQLGIYIYTINKFRNYELRNKESDVAMKFEPNGQSGVGIGFNYKWMGLGMAFSLPFMNKDNDVYGETTRFDLQLHLFSRKFGATTSIQHYKGFHISNRDDFSLNLDDPYPYLGDLESTALGVSWFYFFNNKRFSYKAAFVRNEVQKKGAGSFILGGFFNLHTVSAPSGFVPQELPDSLNQIFNLNGYVTSSLGISFGYTRTFLLFKKKRTFLNLSLVPGIGYRNLSIWNVNTEDKNITQLSGRATIRFSLGYEGKHLYWGIASIITTESFKYETVDISASTGQVKFYLGKRFKIGKKKQTKKQ